MSIFRRAGLALVLCLAACSPVKKEPRMPRAPLYDLVALLPAGEVRREVGGVDFGSFEARAFLASGWSRNERSRDGAAFVWSQGEVSVLQFFLSAPRDLQVAIRCAPLEGAPQAMQVEVNGRGLGTVEMAPGMRDYVLSLPRVALVAGTNRLAFHYRAVSEPSRENGHRRLAVQWSALRFGPARASGAEAPRGEAGGLLIPFGSGVDFFLDLPAAGALSLPKIEGRGAAGGRLAVEVQEEGGKAEARELAPDAAARTVELPGDGERLIRLSLRAVAPAAGADGGLWLSAPAVLAVRVPQESRPAAVRPAAGPRHPNIIVYLVDTLRADRLGCYGATKPVSLSLDTFARTATLFEKAVAQSSWTRPAVTSVLTGLEPLAHGVRTLDDRLADEAVTLPEMLRAAGYQTAGFSTNPHVSAATGLAQGFADFELLPGAARSDVVNQHVVRWLDGQRGSAPFFLYIHTLDPHALYEPPVEMAQRFAPGVPLPVGTLAEVQRAYGLQGEERARRISQLSALYDAEVATNDRSFGALLGVLRRKGLDGSTMIVFLADHGEEFDEHGALGHGNNLYRETLDVPLVVKWPGQTHGQRVRFPAQQVDVLPTILAAAGLRPPQGLPGIDLAALAAAPSSARWPARRNAFSHLSYEGAEGVSVVQGDWKLIVPLNRKFGPAPELYRRDSDPLETNDLAADNEIRAGWLRAQIRLEMLRTQGGHAARLAPVDEETRKALRALGY